MTPGPNKILRIPRSESLIKISTIASGNTFGARWWTDGKMEAPMMPDNPLLRRHPDTDEKFWLDEREEVASEPWGGPSQYPDVPFAEDASESDLKEQLHSESLTPEKECYIRTYLWWLWNDPARSGEDAGKRPEGFDANLRKLVEMLDDEDDSSRLMAAEGLRELGEHEKAAELLDHDFPDEFRTAVDVIREANDNRDVRLHEID